MPTAVRSPKIFGRIKRVLRMKGIAEDVILDPEIYDEMNEGQKQVFLEVPIQHEKTIAMAIGIKDYTLIESTREVYGSIQKFIPPSTWNYPIKYVYPAEWDDIINSGEYDSYTNPVRATIVGNNLKLYPAPLVVENLTLFALLKMPATDLSSTVEPETPEDFDAAIGDWALWKLLGDKTFLESFKNQITVVGNVNGFKGFLIQKPRITGW